VSSRLRLLYPLVVLVALLAFAAAASAGSTSPKETSLEVVASGLDNPRGLDISRSGSLYVAEAGRGGTEACVPSPEGEGEACIGDTGAVTKVWRGGQRRVATGLPSVAGPDGSAATGPHDIYLAYGGGYIPVGLAGDTDTRATFGPLGAGLGQLHRLSSSGRRVYPIADLAAFEQSENPDGGVPDSNPYSVTSLWGKLVVADAGGNDLVGVSRRSGLRTLATFPDRLVPAPPGIPDLPPELPMQAVPTSVVVGPDGALYVGQLTGFPFPKGGANVYRVEPGEEPEVYAEGFTNIIDIAFDRRGNLYVLEIATDGLLAAGEMELPKGALHRVSRKGTTELVISEGLEAPGGLAISRHGDIFVTNRSILPGAGEVVRVKRDHKH